MLAQNHLSVPATIAVLCAICALAGCTPVADGGVADSSEAVTVEEFLAQEDSDGAPIPQSVRIRVAAEIAGIGVATLQMCGEPESQALALADESVDALGKPLDEKQRSLFDQVLEDSRSKTATLMQSEPASPSDCRFFSAKGRN